MFVTKYGTIFGQLPHQMGRVIFVAPSDTYNIDGRAYNSSDDNDGLSPERALRTVSQALTVSRDGEGEVVYLLRGVHAQTATLRWNKSVALVGEGMEESAALGILPPSVLSFIGAAAPGLSIEADNVRIRDLTLRPAAGFSTVIFRNASPDALVVRNVVVDFSKGTASLATLGFDFGYRADVAGLAGTSMTRLAQTAQLATAYFENVRVLSNGANGPGVQTATADLTFVNGRFQNRLGIWATAFAVATGTGYVFLSHSTWGGQAAGSIGVAVDGTNAGIITGKVRCQDLRFGRREPTLSNSPIDNFATNVVEVIECYEALAGGGGATVSAST